MATRILNRRELREQADQAEQAEATTVETPDGSPLTTKTKKPRKAKTPGVPKVRKPRAKKAPPRMCARWGIFDLGMKQMAVFDYNQRAQADEKLADLLVKKKGGYFLQVVKEPMPEPELVEAAPQ